MNSGFEKYTIAQLRPYFHLSTSHAARELNIGVSKLKLICRYLGIGLWVNRRLSSIEKTIKKLEKRLPRESENVRNQIRRKIQNLQDMEQAIMDHPQKVVLFTKEMIQSLDVIDLDAVSAEQLEDAQDKVKQSFAQQISKRTKRAREDYPNKKSSAESDEEMDEEEEEAKNSQDEEEEDEVVSVPVVAKAPAAAAAVAPTSVQKEFVSPRPVNPMVYKPNFVMPAMTSPLMPARTVIHPQISLTSDMVLPLPSVDMDDDGIRLKKMRMSIEDCISPFQPIQTRRLDLRPIDWDQLERENRKLLAKSQ